MKIVLIIVTAIVLGASVARADTSAEDLYAQGQVAYDRGDWQTAIARWTASYELSGEVALLFNVAQAQRQAGDCPAATATYRRYVEADADTASEQHKLAQGFLRELAATCPPAPVSKQAGDHGATQGNLGPQLNSSARLNDHNDRPGRALKIGGLVTGGAGVALLATGLVFGHNSQSIASEVTSACSTSCDWATWKDKDAAGRRDATIGRVLDGVGAAGLATGLVLYYAGVRQSGTLGLAPVGREGGAVVSWGGSW
ncbi:MAG TPA: hypothetical protein VLE97_06265 [Gaiellaceae bacterium]|nr:hypothetical protein [Gaiellaceae bacterium]